MNSIHTVTDKNRENNPFWIMSPLLFFQSCFIVQYVENYYPKQYKLSAQNMQSMKPREVALYRKKQIVTKSVQTELQSLIAFACYDHKLTLRCGFTMNKTDLSEKMYELFMPSEEASDEKDSEHLSLVEQFMNGLGVFKYMFRKVYLSELDQEALVIPRQLHGMDKNLYEA